MRLASCLGVGGGYGRDDDGGYDAIARSLKNKSRQENCQILDKVVKKIAKIVCNSLKMCIFAH